jgi:hypothetical protein
MANVAVVTNGGRAWVVNAAGGTNGSFGSPPFAINVGTGAGTATPSQTALYSEVASARIAVTPTATTTTVANDTFSAVATYTATGAVTLTNAGLFDKSTAGSLLLMLSFDAVALASGDTLTLTFTLQFP